MAKLLIVRHGESQANRDNIFTGWTDSPLTDKGISQAHTVGQMLSKQGLLFDDAHTSYMSRAIKTTNIVLDELDQLYVPIHKTWRLNERHYGALAGQNKALVKKRVGEAQLHRWRRGYADLPPQMTTRTHERRYDRIGIQMPLSESLQMTQERLLPYWQDQIAPRLLDGKNQLVVAHGSSLRALIKYLDQIPDDKIDTVEVPNGEPILYTFDQQLHILDKKFLK